MYDTIMVPLDGSPFSEQALPVAAGIARRHGAQLRLVHVHEPLYGEVFEEIADQEEEYLEGLARDVVVETGIRVGTTRLVGRIIEQLAGFADAWSVDLVVMTTHGRSGFSRAWLGSVADGLIRGAGVPVLALRPSLEPAPGGAGAAGEFRDILVPLDGSELAESALAHALALGGPDAAYTLLAVVPAPIAGEPVAVSFGLGVDREEIDRRRGEAVRYLSGVEGRIRREATRVDAVARVAPLAATAILDVAAERRVDLIAMATHGRGGVRRLVVGSVADKVVRGAECPVLVLHPRDG